MRVLRRVASTGLAIICTIHQPSVDIFLAFDNVLLMAAGGHQVYFGPLGPKAETVVRYITSVEGVASVPHGVNPATWLLETLEATTGTDLTDKSAGRNRTALVVATMSKKARIANLVKHFAGDATMQAQQATVEQMIGDRGSKRSTAVATPSSCLSVVQQFVYLLRRGFKGSWRESAYNCSRLLALVGLGIFYGLLYLNMDDSTFQGMQSRFGAVLAGMGFFGVIAFTIGTFSGQAHTPV
jgi:hypothetical protein